MRLLNRTAYFFILQTGEKICKSEIMHKKYLTTSFLLYILKLVSMN